MQILDLTSFPTSCSRLSCAGNGIRTGWPVILVPTLSTLLLVITLLLQFTSTVPVPDLANSVISRQITRIRNLPPDFRYDAQHNAPIVSRVSTWLTRVPFFPTFAEYHESVVAGRATGSEPVLGGLVDMGVTMRAFLPFDSSSARGSVRSYEGSAMVLDARVICMKLELSNVNLTGISVFLFRIDG